MVVTMVASGSQVVRSGCMCAQRRPVQVSLCIVYNSLLLHLVVALVITALHENVRQLSPKTHVHEVSGF